MKLPNADKAEVGQDKLVDYVLSSEHPVGRFKARFFARLGYGRHNWRALQKELLSLAQGEAELGPRSRYGQKYLVSGDLRGPQATAEVVVVWIVLAGDDIPRLVTVYPK